MITNTQTSRARTALALSLLTAMGAVSLSAQSTWVPTAAGTTYSWQTGTNWSTDPTVPSGVGAVANLTNNIAGAQTISLNGTVTLGTLNIGDSDSTHAFTLQNGTGGSLTFDNTGSTNAVLTKSGTTTDIFNATATLNDNLTVTVNAGILTVSAGSITGSGRTIVVNGPGALGLTNGATRLNVGAGTVAINGGLVNLGNGSNIAVDVINTGASLEMGGDASRASILRQGNFGSAGGATSAQTFAGLSLKSGFSQWNNSTTGTASGLNQSNLNFGTSTYSRQVGSVVQLDQLLTTFGTRTITTATSASTDFGGTRIVIGATTALISATSGQQSGIRSFVTQNGTTGVWGVLTPNLTNSTAPTANDFAVYTSNTGLTAGDKGVATLQVQTGTLTINSTATLTVGSGMVMIGSPASSNSGTISGGTLRSGTQELFLIGSQSTNGQTNTVNSVIANSSLGATALTVSLAGGGSSTNFSRMVLNGVNTYTGDTILVNSVSGIANNYLQLGSSGELLFSIGANGVNNQVRGAGNFIVDGDFRFNLAGAGIANGNSWQIVAPSISSTFGANFAVQSSLGAFTETANVWTLVDGSNTWTFTEASGVLSLTAIPEPSAFATLAGLGAVGVAAIRRRRRA